jgi:hypothetical protein
MCKEMPVIPVNKVVDPKRIIGKNGTRGHCPPPKKNCPQINLSANVKSEQRRIDACQWPDLKSKSLFQRAAQQDFCIIYVFMYYANYLAKARLSKYLFPTCKT